MITLENLHTVQYRSISLLYSTAPPYSTVGFPYCTVMQSFPTVQYRSFSLISYSFFIIINTIFDQKSPGQTWKKQKQQTPRSSNVFSSFLYSPNLYILSAKFGSIKVEIINIILKACKWCKICKFLVNSMLISCRNCLKWRNIMHLG